MGPRGSCAGPEGARGGAPRPRARRRRAGGFLSGPRPRWARRSAGRGGKAAGRGGDLWAFQASRCLFGPPIVSPASQWGCCSRSAGPRRGPRPARARGPRGGAGRPAVVLRSPVRPSARPPRSRRRGAGPALPASVPAHDPRARPEGIPRPDVRPRPWRPLLTRRRAPGSARLARPAPPRPGRTHRGPFFPAPRNHMANPRRHSSPRSFRRRMSRNGEQSQLCSRLLWMRTGEKKNHLTPRDSQLITNHM